MKILCWNIAGRHAAWRSLATSDADIALLQEAGAPPDDVARRLDVNPVPFQDDKELAISRTAVARLSGSVEVEWLKPVPLAEAKCGDFVASQPGCIPAAIISAHAGDPIVVESICAEDEKPHSSTGQDIVGHSRRLGPPRDLGPLTVDRRAVRAPHHRCRRPHRGTRLRCQRVLETEERHGFRTDGCARASTRRSAVPQRSTGGPMAGWSAEGQPGHSNLLQYRQFTIGGELAARLRVRVRKHRGLDHGAGAERPRRVGTKRPRQAGNPARMTRGTTRRNPTERASPRRQAGIILPQPVETRVPEAGNVAGDRSRRFTGRRE